MEGKGRKGREITLCVLEPSPALFGVCLPLPMYDEYLYAGIDGLEVERV